jgi:HlyD family secretion protein
MKITQLKRLGAGASTTSTTPTSSETSTATGTPAIPETSATSGIAASAVRGTAGQDAPVTNNSADHRRRLSWYAGSAGAIALLAAFAWLAHAWSNSSHTVSADRLRIVTVQQGHFVRDVAAQGTVVAAVNPTLFAIAAGTVSYTVHAGDTAAKGAVLATLDSPELSNEYQRERATLDSLNSALARQEIEIRRQLLTSQQQSDLAQVAIKAAERELKRAQWAWDQHAMSERDYQHAIDDVSTAKLNFDHARDTAGLERDSVVLDLRTRRLERDRQAFVVAGLQHRIEELTVRSPVNGMVANLAQPEKTRVAENTPLLTVVDLTAFEIEFQVAETYASDIKPGMTADINLGGHAVPGTVTAISPEVRQNEVTGRVKFNSPQQPGLRQNERASLRIVLDERDNVVKFEHGAGIDEATHAVYVVRGDQAVRTPVELGAASVSEIEVVRGLAPGDKIIISDTRDFNEAPALLIGK